MNLSVRFSNAKQMKHVIARAIACSIMLLVLPSCGIPPLRQPEPGPGLPADFNGATSAENSAQLGIEEFYNDPNAYVLDRTGTGRQSGAEDPE